jgi:lipoic acid synthetase
VYLIRRLNPDVKIELLIPDFNNSESALKIVVSSAPDVIGHNLETTRNMYPKIRPLGNYRRSLNVLKSVRKLGFAGLIKSGIMLGFGETDEEVLRAVVDLKKSDCDILTLGQYLSPAESSFPVREFISPEKFEFYRRKALDLGFKAVNCGPLVRSSYRAEEVYSNISG